MKIPITDQFLWDLYKQLKRADDLVDFLLANKYKQIRMMTGHEPIFKKYRKVKSSQEFSKFIYKLKINNYIKIKNLEGKKAISLTKRGEDKALKASFRIEPNKKKRRDGKWIMIIFDIPQNYWKHRSLLKSVLVNLGYKKFQQSVWITPYDVYKKTEDLLQYYSLDKYVRIFLIEKL